MIEEIRLGTIGSGPIVRSILDNVSRVEGIRLAAVYSRSGERGKALADDYGAAKVYTEMEAFLKDEEINFVYVATPNLLHYEQTKNALLSEKNVICEKPFCTQAKQAAELTALAREKGLFLIDAVPTAFLPNLEILKAQLPKIGKIKLVMGNYSQYSSRYDQLLEGKVPNIFNPEYAGGCLMDINFYNVYLTVALFGMPKETAYYPNFHTNARGGRIDTSGVALLVYEDFVSQLSGAKDTWGVNFFQIEGESGYIYIKGGSNMLSEIKVVTKKTEECLNEQSNPDRWFYEVQNLTRQILTGDYESAFKGLDTMQQVVAVLENTRKKAGILFPGD
jgi:predicted dehydrogenase